MKGTIEGVIRMMAEARCLVMRLGCTSEPVWISTCFSGVSDLLEPVHSSSLVEYLGSLDSASLALATV